MPFSLVAALILFGHAPDTSFAEKMRSPATRQVAACVALERFKLGLDEGPCRVNHVIESEGPKGKRVFVVFFAHSFDRDEGPGKALGHFEVFDEAGRHVPLFLNSNYLDGDSMILEAPDAPLILVQEFSEEPSCPTRPPDHHPVTVRTVYAISLASPERPLLSVFVGPPTRDQVVIRTTHHPCETLTINGAPQRSCPTARLIAPAYAWNWMAGCDGLRCHLRLGPGAALSQGDWSAEYQWTAGVDQVTGPPRTVFDDFLSHDPDDVDAIDRFASAHGFAGCHRAPCTDSPKRYVR